MVQLNANCYFLKLTLTITVTCHRLLVVIAGCVRIEILKGFNSCWSIQNPMLLYQVQRQLPPPSPTGNIRSNRQY